MQGRTLSPFCYHQDWQSCLIVGKWGEVLQLIMSPQTFKTNEQQTTVSHCIQFKHNSTVTITPRGRGEGQEVTYSFYRRKFVFNQKD